MRALCLWLVLAAVNVTAGEVTRDYSKAIVGCWLRSRKFEIYHADGTWRVKRTEDAPEDVRGRRWHVRGNKLIITYPGDHGLETALLRIISLTDHKMVLEFVYLTYIRTTPEKLWSALIKPEFTRQFWFNTTQESEWKAGASWKILIPDGRVADSGEVLEVEPRRRLVLKWRHELGPELKAEGYLRLTYQLEKEGKSVKLTVIHEIEKEGSKFIEAVSTGWPHILVSLKSFLETGESLEETRAWPRDACK